MKKIIILLVLSFSIFQSCSQRKDIAVLKFNATIFFTNVDYMLRESYGALLDLKVKFPKVYKGRHNKNISTKNIRMDEHGYVSAKFVDEIEIKTDSVIGKVPFQWIIEDFPKEHIVNDSLFIIPGNETSSYLMLDISNLEIAESEWSKSYNTAHHKIWLKNNFKENERYNIDSVDFSITYYSNRDVDLEEKIITYSNSLFPNEVKEISLDVPNLKNPKIIESAAVTIKKVYYTRKKYGI